MLHITATQRWRETHPGALIGLLEISGVRNADPASTLDEAKRRIEAEVRARYADFSRQDFKSLPVIAVYQDYYKRFKKTYHVLQQVESVALKGRSLPTVSPLVDANFAAEIETLLLTAGHDVAKLNGEITIDIAEQGESITKMAGASKALYADDMVMRVGAEVVCSIIYGQDNASFITPQTEHVLYVTYAPAGVTEDDIRRHHAAIGNHVRLFAQNAIVEQDSILKTG